VGGGKHPTLGGFPPTRENRPPGWIKKGGIKGEQGEFAAAGPPHSTEGDQDGSGSAGSGGVGEASRTSSRRASYVGL